MGGGRAEAPVNLTKIASSTLHSGMIKSTRFRFDAKMKLNTSSPTLNSVTFALNFSELDAKVRFKQAQAEDAFAPLVNGQSQQTNIPDAADPTQPRIIFQSEKKTIAISQVGIYLQMNFLDSQLPILKQFEVVEKNVLEFFSRADRFVDASKLSNQGLIVEVCFPTEDSPEVVRAFVHEQFLKMPLKAELGSVHVLVGYKIDGLFVNLSASDYETRDFKVEKTGYIRLNDFPVKSYGYMAKIDINNVPSAMQDMSVGSTAKIFTQLRSFVNTDFKNVFGLDIF